MLSALTFGFHSPLQQKPVAKTSCGFLRAWTHNDSQSQPGTQTL